MTLAETVLTVAAILLGSAGMFAAFNTDAEPGARACIGTCLLSLAVWLLLMGAT